jgi:hypothetical protein
VYLTQELTYVSHILYHPELDRQESFYSQVQMQDAIAPFWPRIVIPRLSVTHIWRSCISDNRNKGREFSVKLGLVEDTELTYVTL